MERQFQDKVAIIGLPRAGTTSLKKYLESKGIQVQRPEIFYYGKSKHGTEYAKNVLKDYQLVVVTRNPAERLRSCYNAFKFNERMSWEEFVQTNHPPEWKAMGLCELINKTDEDYAKEWADFDITYIDTAELSKLEGYPHLNKNGFIAN